MGRRLKIVWGILDSLYLGSALFAIIFAIFIKMGNPATGRTAKHTLRSLVISNYYTNAAIALGALIIASWLVGLYGAITGMAKGKRRVGGFIAFNWSLIAVAAATTIIGSIIWFLTLRPRNEFFAIWQEQDLTVQAYLQDTLQCCGFFDVTVAGGFNAMSTFCSTFAAGTNSTAATNCVIPILAFEDYALNNIFSTCYGFVAIQAALFLATCCMINVRVEEERFRLIDEKTGVRGGFV